MTHAIYSPSSAERWFNCPGSALLSAQCPETKAGSKGSGAASEGTAAHEEAAKVLRGEGISCSDPGIELYLDHIMIEGLKETKLAEFIEFPVRSKVKGVYGTLDYALLTKSRLVVMDFKYGKQIRVDPTAIQLQLYAYMMIEMLLDSFDLPNVLELHIVQPRYEGADPVRIAVHNLYKFAQEFGPRFYELMEDQDSIDLTDPENYNMGSWCRWCRGTTACPAQRKKLAGLFENVNADLNVNDALVDVLNKAYPVKKLIAEAEKRAKELLKEGKTLDGWQLNSDTLGRTRLARAKTTAEQWNARFEEDDNDREKNNQDPRISFELAETE